MRKADMKLFLDLFFSMFPGEYNDHYREGVTTEQMFERLRREEPTCFDEVFREYDRLYIS